MPLRVWRASRKRHRGQAEKNLPAMRGGRLSVFNRWLGVPGDPGYFMRLRKKVGMSRSSVL